MGEFLPQEPEFVVALISARGRWQVYLSLHAAVVAWHHALAHPDHEVAGLLLGGVGYGRPPFCRCDRAFPARFCWEEPTSVTLTFQTWDDLARRQRRLAPHLSIVGWYHSHPGLGIFLSPDDVVAHLAAFGIEGTCAVVIDPHRREWQGFVLDGGSLRPASLLVYAPRNLERDLRQFLSLIHGATPRRE